MHHKHLNFYFFHFVTPLSSKLRYVLNIYTQFTQCTVHIIPKVCSF